MTIPTAHKLLAAALVASAPAVASAAPTYVTCNLVFPGGAVDPTGMRFALDEATQTVGITFPTGKTQNAPAAFTATTVGFSDSNFEWQIDRTTLNAQARALIGGSAGPVLTGTCRVEQAPNRAF